MDEYRQRPEINVSTLVHGLHSMRRLKRIIDEPPHEPTDAMQLGTAIHCAILEPSKFQANYVCMPAFHLDSANVTQGGKQTKSKATSYYKAMVEEFEKDNSDKIILSEYDMHRIIRCVQEVAAKPGLSNLIDSCQKEVELYGEIDGVACKGRVDLVRDGYLADLKTTNDAEPRAFGRTYGNLNYSFKLAFYRELADQNGYQIESVQVIAQETSGDYDTVVYDVPPLALDVAFRKVRSVLAQYQECKASGVWPGVDGGSASMLVYLPPWELEIEDDLEWSDTSDQESEEVIW